MSPGASSGFHFGLIEELSVSCTLPSPPSARLTIVSRSIACAIAVLTFGSSSAGCGFFRPSPPLMAISPIDPWKPGTVWMFSSCFSSLNPAVGISVAASISPVFRAATIASPLLNLRRTTSSTAGLPP